MTSLKHTCARSAVNFIPREHSWMETTYDLITLISFYGCDNNFIDTIDARVN